SQLDGGALFGAIQAIGKIGVEPRDVDADRALIHAARATGAELGEARVFELAGAGFPRTADTAGIRFATERVAADGLEIRAGIQASATTNAVERLFEDGVVAHFHAPVVDQDEVEFAIFRRFAREKKHGIGKRGADEAGVDGESLAGGAGRKKLDERSHFLTSG